MERDAPDAPDAPSRRRFLGGAALGAAAGAAVWAAPQVLSVDAASAATVPPPELIAVQSNKGTTFETISVGGFSAGSVGEIAFVLVPLNGADDVTATVADGAGPAWTPLVTAFDSDVTTPGTSGTGGTGARVRLYVWGRAGATTDTTIDFTLTGTTGLTGNWRGGVAEVGNITGVGTGAGEVLAVGSGTATTTDVPGPGVTPSGNGVVIFIGGGDVTGTINTFPAGYSTWAFNGPQPLYLLAAKNVPAGAVPATSATLAAAMHTVGAQVTLLS